MLRRVVGFCQVIGCAFTVWAAQGQTAPHAGAGAPTVQVLFASDIHFEPFWDPAKAAQLKAAPASEWNRILASPASEDRQERFEVLQQKCKAKGVDTDYALFDSSLRAMRVDAAQARFAIVSGDLIAHNFSCKFATVFPDAKPEEYRDFVEKTIDYVMGELRSAVRGAPVYAALGNNDSDCGDYELDANGEFLKWAGRSLAADVPAAERAEALRTFSAEGDYSVRLPAPMENTRLLVLDDLFMSRRYQTCGGKEDARPAAEQIAWLKRQLDEARTRKQKVWVMTHIPPGVDPYSTATKGKNICQGNKPTMFLSSEALPELMAEYGDVIQLAIFAHTHMDEVRLLEPTASETVHGGVAVKMIASISPVDGNNPSFTVGRVDAATATLKDYRVIAASNQSGFDTEWREEYDFADAYKEPAFTAAALGDLIGRFAADPSAQTDASQGYIHNYGTGVGARTLGLLWPLYVCSLKNDSADALTACVCGK